MPGEALRLPWHLLRRAVRSARLAVRLLPAVLVAWPLAADTPPPLLGAAYAEPTTRYPHGALGDETEWGALVLQHGGGSVTIRLGPDSVFEDTAPRLVDLDGDGRDEVMVVESHQTLGARLAVYDRDGLIAATPHIGQRFRWLAPLGAADLDGDGRVEIAYVDRPHLARILRVWRLEAGALREVASLGDVTNHRFGAPEISGGIRRCDGPPEIIAASADWRSLLAIRLIDGTLSARVLSSDTSPHGFAAALSCS